MKSLDFLFDNPLAPGFGKSVDNMLEAIGKMTKAGIITQMRIFYDDNREAAVKETLANRNLPCFTQDDLAQDDESKH
jgi:hypothetical protein